MNYIITIIYMNYN